MRLFNIYIFWQEMRYLLRWLLFTLKYNRQVQNIDGPKKMSRKTGFSIIKEICYNWFVRHCSQRWQLISRGHRTCSHPEEPCPTPGSTPGYNPLQYLLRPPSWILAVNKQTDLDTASIIEFASPSLDYDIFLSSLDGWNLTLKCT